MKSARTVVALVAILAILATTGEGLSADTGPSPSPPQPSIVSPSTTQPKLLSFATFTERLRGFEPPLATRAEQGGGQSAGLLGRYHVVWVQTLTAAGLAQPEYPQYADLDVADNASSLQIARAYAAIQLYEADALVRLPKASERRNMWRLECLTGISVATVGVPANVPRQSEAFAQGFTRRSVPSCLA